MISYGVPQGSKLSADLFNIYANDIQDVQLHGELHLYADDILITYNYSDYTIIENNINEDLQSLRTWMNRNKLTINTDKTKYIQ